MKKVLAISRSIDQTVEYLSESHSDKIKFFRLNVDKLESYRFSITNDGFQISSPEWIISSDEVDAVYYRKISFPDLSEYEAGFQSFMQREIMGVVEGVAETAGKICVTRPSLLRRAENKIVQLRLARQLGFSIPKSLITNSSEKAQSFIHNQKSIIKPLTTGRIANFGIIQTNEVTSNSPINNLSLSPSYFQQYVSKDNSEYRVTIVGHDVFAVRIDSSDKIDWRKRNAINDYTVVEIPTNLKQQCFSLMDELQIEFAAFDFIGKNEDYVFLEVNPNGEWLWLEKALNIPISHSLIRLLRGDYTNGK